MHDISHTLTATSCPLYRAKEPSPTRKAPSLVRPGPSKRARHVAPVVSGTEGGVVDDGGVSLHQRVKATVAIPQDPGTISTGEDTIVLVPGSYHLVLGVCVGVFSAPCVSALWVSMLVYVMPHRGLQRCRPQRCMAYFCVSLCRVGVCVPLAQCPSCNRLATAPPTTRPREKCW